MVGKLNVICISSCFSINLIKLLCSMLPNSYKLISDMYKEKFRKLTAFSGTSKDRLAEFNRV